MVACMLEKCERKKSIMSSCDAFRAIAIWHLNAIILKWHYKATAAILQLKLQQLTLASAADDSINFKEHRSLTHWAVPGWCHGAIGHDEHIKRPLLPLLTPLWHKDIHSTHPTRSPQIAFTLLTPSVYTRTCTSSHKLRPGQGMGVSFPALRLYLIIAVR